jgi:hypothetical protein
MKGHHGRKKVPKVEFFPRHNFFLLLITFCPFMNMLNKFFFTCYDHDNFSLVYPPLKFVHISPHCITDFDQNIPSDPCDYHGQVDEPYEIKVDISHPLLDPTPSKIQQRYKPLKLPHILHNFPPNHYKYLPVFDAEPNTITAEKHIQDFEYFIDLFEIDHDYVCMKAFFQSLKGDTKY